MKQTTRNWLNVNNIPFDVYYKEGEGQVLEVRKQHSEKVIKYLDYRFLMISHKEEGNNVIITLSNRR